MPFEQLSFGYFKEELEEKMKDPAFAKAYRKVVRRYKYRGLINRFKNWIRSWGR